MSNSGTGELSRPSLDDVTVFVAAGGLGTRARPEIGDDKPKALIDLGDKSVLYRLCRGLGEADFDDLVLCVAHLKEEIKEHVASWDLDLNYRISDEEGGGLLGPERAVLQAIYKGPVRRRSLILPGDMVSPAHKLAEMADLQATEELDAVLAATRVVSERTPRHHIGRLVVKNLTNELLECRKEPADPENPLPGTQSLTSLGGIIVTTNTFVRLCERTLKEQPPEPGEMVDLKDRFLASAIEDPNVSIQAFDFGEEVIDLGEPSSIRHAQRQKWE